MAQGLGVPSSILTSLHSDLSTPTSQVTTGISPLLGFCRFSLLFPPFFLSFREKKKKKISLPLLSFPSSRTLHFSVPFLNFHSVLPSPIQLKPNYFIGATETQGLQQPLGACSTPRYGKKIFKGTNAAANGIDTFHVRNYQGWEERSWSQTPSARRGCSKFRADNALGHQQQQHSNSNSPSSCSSLSQMDDPSLFQGFWAGRWSCFLWSSSWLCCCQ